MSKRIAMIIAFERFRDEEYAEPKQIFEKAGHSVTTLSSKLGEATGKLGMKVKVDLTLNQLKVDEYDAVLFVGGPGSFNYHRDPKAHRIVKDAVKLDKVLGAICGAPPILGFAGALTGKKVTMFEDTGDLALCGAFYTGADVEIDGKIVTATGPKTARAWAEAICKMLK